MSIQYRPAPGAAEDGTVGYLDVVWLGGSRTLYGALFVMNRKGQPLEFVHSTVTAPAGFLWPQKTVQAVGTATLCRALFDACKSQPDLLICGESLGSAAYLREEVAPLLPFAQVTGGGRGGPAMVLWISDAPEPDSRPARLIEHLQRSQLIREPLDRLRAGLREVYTGAPWD